MVQTCQEEQGKKHPDFSISVAGFAKKCAERWKTMSAKGKSKFEDMATSDKACCDREMKNYAPPKGEKKGKGKKDTNAPKRPPTAFLLFVLNLPQREKVNPLAYLLGTLQNMWVKCGLNSEPKINNHVNREQPSERRNMNDYGFIPRQGQT